MRFLAILKYFFLIQWGKRALLCTWVTKHCSCHPFPGSQTADIIIYYVPIDN